jgi:hypothetical protein
VTPQNLRQSPVDVTGIAPGRAREKPAVWSGTLRGGVTPKTNRVTRRIERDGSAADGVTGQEAYPTLTLAPVAPLPPPPRAQRRSVQPPAES